MSQSYVLDTSVLLALIRGKALGTYIDRVFGLRAGLHRQVVSVVTHAELLVLADRGQWGSEKRSTLERALENLVVIPIDGASLLQAYVSISAADRAAAGGTRNMGKNDIWIAATALHTELPLLTTDKDFRFLQDNPLQVMWIDPLSE
ncbi:MAG TPA: PIN domain-containing protein [Bryobacteraceae bacterium]|nr:PIN domain-containing protein [Bryobacteraceae bacterium]